MPSLQCTLTTFLWDVVRLLPDVAGLSGYNMYEGHIHLQGSDIPVTIAHYTRSRRLPQGVLARVLGSAHTVGKSFIIVATNVIPMSLVPLPGPLPKDYDLLARLVFSGVVCSPYMPLQYNAEGFSVEIKIDRPDVYPPVPMILMAVFNRDASRVALNSRLAIGSNVYGRGIVCGWAGSNRLMVDVHHIGHNNAGDTPKQVLTDTLNPFRRVSFGSDGWPSRDPPPPPPDSSRPRPWDIFSFSTTPTRVTRANSVADPRLRLTGVNSSVPSEETQAAVDPPSDDDSRAGPSTAVASTSAPQRSVQVIDLNAERGTAGPSIAAVDDRHNGMCPCGAKKAQDCAARLVTGWRPGPSTTPLPPVGAAPQDSTGPAVESDAVAALLSLGTGPRVHYVRLPSEGAQSDDGESSAEIPLSSLTAGSSSRTANATGVYSGRKSLKRKGTTRPVAPRVAGESAPTAPKRPRVILNWKPRV